MPHKWPERLARPKVCPGHSLKQVGEAGSLSWVKGRDDWGPLRNEEAPAAFMASTASLQEAAPRSSQGPYHFLVLN